MRIELDHRLFRSQRGETLADLSVLVLALNNSPHHLHIDGDAQGRRAYADWLASEGRPALRRYYAQIVAHSQSARALRSPSNTVLLVSDEQDEDVELDGHRAVASLARATKLVAKPLQLWLENDHNDRDFLLTVAPPGPLREFLKRAHAREWIEYRHGGGSDLIPRLAKLDAWQRLRAWAMCDADTWEPGVESPQVKLLRRATRGVDPKRVSRRERRKRTDDRYRPSMPLEVLERRAIENYLPPRALKHWANLRLNNNHEQRRKQQRFAQAVEQLDEYTGAPFNLRHYYHLENGFRSEPDKIPAAYDLFRSNTALDEGIKGPIKTIYAGNIAAREEGGHGWFEDAWFAADEALSAEVVGIIDSIRKRL